MACRSSPRCVARAHCAARSSVRLHTRVCSQGVRCGASTLKVATEQGKGDKKHARRMNGVVTILDSTGVALGYVRDDLTRLSRMCGRVCKYCGGCPEISPCRAAGSSMRCISRWTWRVTCQYAASCFGTSRARLRTGLRSTCLRCAKRL